MNRSVIWLPMAALVGAVLVSGCASLSQPEDQVYRRPSGGQLEEWKDVWEASRIFLPYAWASVAVYQDADDPHRKPLHITADRPEPHAFLKEQGWTRWDTLPLLARAATERTEYAKQGELMRDVHLRAEVWAHEQRKEVVVAFGGTAFSSAKDWKSNFHWLGQHFGAVDAYTVLSDSFVPMFIEEFVRRRDRDGQAWLKDAKVIATGHSLGGGLAQRFAYTTWTNPQVPRAATVYAFDPSPVSGKRSTPGYDANARDAKPFKGLTIHRIYNRGEFLASLRSVLSWGNRDPDSNEDGQNWVDYRYKYGWSLAALLPTGMVHMHAMHDLACFMRARAFEVGAHPPIGKGALKGSEDKCQEM